MKEKNFILKNLTQLRNNRNYLHSTDVFDQIIFLNKNKNLTNLKIYFRKPIEKVPFLIIKTRASTKCRIKVMLTLTTLEIEKKFGYVIVSNKKLLTRKIYHENLLQKKIKFKKMKL